MILQRLKYAVIKSQYKSFYTAHFSIVQMKYSTTLTYVNFAVKETLLVLQVK